MKATIFSGLALLFCAILPLSAQQPTAATSLVRVNVTNQSYNFYQPWEKRNPSSKRGLGSFLATNQVLVTAQLVADATYIQLELAETGEKATAKVDQIDYEANLALLSLAEDNATFLEGLVPLEIESETSVGDKLEVWQIEDNGTAISTTGEVTRVDTTGYFLDNTVFLTYHLKGSLEYRSGSFTLPVIQNKKLAGLLISYDSKEQISRILPGPIIDHFLKDRDDGSYDGFPTLGLRYARTTDEQLQNYLKLKKGDGGVYISTVVPGSTADKGGLKVGDVLLELGGFAIDNRGYFDHPKYGKLNLSHIARGASHVGDKLRMRVLRDGDVVDLTAEMTRKEPEDYLVDPYMFDRGPRFLISGGLVFQELTLPYLKIFGKEWRTRAPFKLLYANKHPDELEKEGRKKVVFLSRVIRTPATLGYEGLSHIILEKANGRTINSIKDLNEALKSPSDGVHKFEFDDVPKVIYTDAEVSEDMNGRIQEAFRIQDIKRLN